MTRKLRDAAGNTWPAADPAQRWGTKPNPLHGPALMRFLDAEFKARGVAPSTWARMHNISPATFTRWRNGSNEPTIDVIDQIATALNRSVADLIVATGYTDAEDFGIPPVVPTRRPTFTEAIAEAEDLTDTEREALTGLLDVVRTTGVLRRTSDDA